MKIRLIKLIDKTFGSLMARILPAPSPSRTPVFSRFLVIRPGGIGDAVMLIPAIQAIKKKYPRSYITVLAEKRNSSAFLLSPVVDKTFHYDKPKELIKAIQNHYDVVIDTEQWHSLSAVAARLTRAPMMIGFASNEREKLFTHTASYSHDVYESDSFFRLLAPLSISVSDSPQSPYLVVPEVAQKRADILLAGLAGKTFVVVFPGASIPERRWGTDRFRKLAEKMFNLEISVVLVGGNEVASDGERIIDGKFGLNLAGKTSLVETAAIIEKALILVSGDSGVLHIGVGLGKPTVSLFGPGIAKKWAPRGENHIVINKNLPCSPCTKFGYTPKCRLNAKCMSEITIDEVEAAINKLIE